MGITLLDNQCNAIFICFEHKQKQCVYFKNGEKVCKFYNTQTKQCGSAIACVNECIKQLKARGFDYDKEKRS